MFTVDGPDATAPPPPTVPETEENLARTLDFWQGWVRNSRYRGRWPDMVHRSAITLKLLTYAPTGAPVAAATMGLPEQIGGERNWDYRYTWVRDGSLSLRALIDLGFTEEATAFTHWLRERLVERLDQEGEALQIMYRVDGTPLLGEEILEHFEGYRGSSPVRVGNAASDQLQLDIYGEALYALAEGRAVGEQGGYHGWKALSGILDWLADSWDRPDEGIWETRGGRKDFTYSRVMCWAAFDRGLKLAAEFSRPADTVRWTKARDEILEQVMARGWSEKQQAIVQHYDGDVLDASLLLAPRVGFVSPRSPGWLSTLDAMERVLVSDSLVYRYDPGPPRTDCAAPKGRSASARSCTSTRSPGLDGSPRPATPSRRCRRTPTMSVCSPRRSAPVGSSWATSRRPSPICPSSWPRRRWTRRSTGCGPERRDVRALRKQFHGHEGHHGGEHDHRDRSRVAHEKHDQNHGADRQPERGGGSGGHAGRHGRHDTEPRERCQQGARRTAEEQRGEHRAAPQAAQAQCVRDGLEQNHGHQTAGRPGVRVGGELGEGGLAGQGHLGRRAPGDGRVERRAAARAERAQHRGPQRVRGHRAGRVPAATMIQWRPTPMTSAMSTDQTTSPMSRVEGAGSPISRLPVCRPVQSPKPVNTMAPTPLESSAGSITANSCGPPTPATSISSTAATKGLPKIAEIAAAAPAAPSSAVLAGVAGTRTRSRKSRARPPPRAISGDSGPSTAPSGRPARAASATPGRAEAATPSACRPEAGMCPPRPGSHATIRPTSTPARSIGGSGHHHGGSDHPRSCGHCSHIRCSSSWRSTRNQNAASETGTPIRAQNTSARR